MVLLSAVLCLLATAAVAEDNPDVAARHCVACADVPNPRLLYSPTQWRELERGSILLADTGEPGAENGAGASTASGLIPHSPEQVWTVLTDFETWPRFMPHITRTQVTHRLGNRMWVHQRYKILLLGMQHTTIYDLHPRFGQLSWVLDPSQQNDIKSSEGRWQLLPANGGEETLIRYGAAMDAGRSVPDFVENTLRHRSVKDMITSLRDEVARRYGNGSAE